MAVNMTITDMRNDKLQSRKEKPGIQFRKRKI